MNNDKIDSNRIMGLDVLRVLAMVIIFLFHSYQIMGIRYGILNGVVRMGAMFMTSFFLLSGFLSYYSNRERNMTSQNNIIIFYKKKWLSIMPLYYIITVFCVVARVKMNLTITQILFALLVDVLGIQAFLGRCWQIVYPWGYSWFISCILFCYLCYPFIQEIVKQLSFKQKIYIMICCSLILLIAPLALIILGEEESGSIYINPVFRGMEFLLGVLLASVEKNISNLKKVRVLFSLKAFVEEMLLMIVLVSLGIYLNIGVDNHMLYNWIGLPIFCIMILTMTNINWNNRKIILKIDRGINYIARRSYVFYLSQILGYAFMSEILLKRIYINSIILKLAIAFIICIILSEILQRVNIYFAKLK